VYAVRCSPDWQVFRYNDDVRMELTRCVGSFLGRMYDILFLIFIVLIFLSVHAVLDICLYKDTC